MFKGKSRSKGEVRNVLETRDPKTGKLTGSQSLSGIKPVKATKKVKFGLSDVLFGIAQDFQVATAEVEATRQMAILKAQITFWESLPDKVKPIYAKHKNDTDFNIKLLTDQIVDFPTKQTIRTAYGRDYVIAKAKAENSYLLDIAPFRRERAEGIRKAKKDYPKRWWQSKKVYLRDACASCGNKIETFCAECNTNA